MWPRVNKGDTCCNRLHNIILDACKDKQRKKIEWTHRHVRVLAECRRIPPPKGARSLSSFHIQEPDLGGCIKLEVDA